MNTGEQPRRGQPPGSSLRPPGTPPESLPKSTAKHGLIWAALAIVVVLGLGVLLVLPKMVSERAGENTQGSVESNAATGANPSTIEGQDQAVSRSEAAMALQDFLMARARLELANAPVWGEPQWSQAVAAAARGNAFFGQRQFSAASAAFNDSLERLLALEAETGQRLAGALESGWKALLLNDSDSATDFFTTAIAIDAGNEEANMGQERAQIRPDLLELMDAGELALAMNELQKAQAAYSEAVELDGLYEPAKFALQDINGQITDLEFNAAMSRVLSAMQKEQVEAAELALQQAASLKPGEEVVADTRYQLVQLRQNLWLASQRQMAATRVSNENWADAVLIYKRVLAKAPQAAFARQGLVTAKDRARLHQQLDHYLEDPGRVYSVEPRANAEKLLASAGRPPADEVRLAEKIHDLQRLIVEAQTPSTVTLQSDGLTNVMIFHVGRLGTFTSHQLELPPGIYTVVGSRPGYRDVRQTFTVKPGSDQTSLVIRCEETV
jgi:tetratricopeptide (TPR) repeat protein